MAFSLQFVQYEFYSGQIKEPAALQRNTLPACSGIGCRHPPESPAALLRILQKKTNFANVPDEQIKNIENWLNNRPRKCLNFMTPNEAYKSERCT